AGGRGGDVGRLRALADRGRLQRIRLRLKADRGGVGLSRRGRAGLRAESDRRCTRICQKVPGAERSARAARGCQTTHGDVAVAGPGSCIGVRADRDVLCVVAVGQSRVPDGGVQAAIAGRVGKSTESGVDSANAAHRVPVAGGLGAGADRGVEAGTAGVGRVACRGVAAVVTAGVGRFTGRGVGAKYAAGVGKIAARDVRAGGAAGVGLPAEGGVAAVVTAGIGERAGRGVGAGVAAGVGGISESSVGGARVDGAVGVGGRSAGNVARGTRRGGARAGLRHAVGAGSVADTHELR